MKFAGTYIAVCILATAAAVAGSNEAHPDEQRSVVCRTPAVGMTMLMTLNGMQPLEAPERGQP